MTCFIVTLFMGYQTLAFTCASFNTKTDIGRRCIAGTKEYPAFKVKDSYSVKRVKGQQCHKVLKAKKDR